MKSVPACLLYEGLGIESRAVGQPSGPRPLLSSCENASTFTLSPSQTESNRAGQKSRKRPLLIFNTYVSVSRCEIALSRDSPPIGSLIRREILQTLISQKKILLPCQGLKCYLLLERPLDLVLRAFHWKRSDARAVAKILQNGQLSFA